jgi:DNA-binding PadR family transcriptional regulator
MDQFKPEHIPQVKRVQENLRKEIVQRITRNLLDIQILRLIQAQPMWGYRIKKHVETNFYVRLRHGALYPLLNKMEQKGFLESQEQQQGGRTRKVYTVTPKGKLYVEIYNDVLKDQLTNPT